MQHLEEGTLHALLDGELAGEERATAQAHLADCPACRANLAEARALASEALGLIEQLDGAPESLIGDGPGVVAERTFFAPRPASPILREPRPEDIPVFTPARGTPVPAPAAATSEPGVPIESPSPRKQPRRWRWLAPVGLAAAAVLAVVLRPRAPDSGATAEKQVIAAAPTRTEPVTPAPDSPPAPPAQRRVTGTAAPRRSAPPAAAADSAPRPAAPPASTANVTASADQATKLEELVITPKDAKSLASRVAASAKVAGTAGAVPTVSADQAVTLLGGSMRRVEGLVPVRYEQQGSVIRVVYETTWGPLFLDQWREGKTLTHRLLANPGTPKDSVAAWSERIR